MLWDSLWKSFWHRMKIIQNETWHVSIDKYVYSFLLLHIQFSLCEFDGCCALKEYSSPKSLQMRRIILVLTIEPVPTPPESHLHVYMWFGGMGSLSLKLPNSSCCGMHGVVVKGQVLVYVDMAICCTSTKYYFHPEKNERSWYFDV